MSFTGMDIGQVRSLSQQMKSKADEIESIMSTLTSALSGAQWVGPDRQKFEGEWTQQYCTALRNVAEGLRTAATTADQNATQQEQASNA
ncbi:MAG: hypothetical protein JWM47_2094 [Acidimicrobiales bacterium]|nr:hypothetical protein [Acidimicrobiales bacterium]